MVPKNQQQPATMDIPIKAVSNPMSLGDLISTEENLGMQHGIVGPFEIPKEKTIPQKRNSSSKKSASAKLRPYQCEKWQERFVELLEFKNEFGHCLVPHDYPANPQLARWVKRQRYQYNVLKQGKKASITNERIKILNSHGFVWDSHEAAWEERIRQLKDFKEKHGNCSIPARYPDNPQLATWAKCQRRQYKLHNEGKPCNISVERILSLERLGFEWELRPSKATETQKILGSFLSSNAENDYDLMLDVLSILSGESEPATASSQEPQIPGMQLEFFPDQVSSEEADMITQILTSDDDQFDDDLFGLS